MSKDEFEIIEAEACTPVNESIVKQVRKLLDSEGRSEMAKMFKIVMDHYEKTGKVIYRFELNFRTSLNFSFCRTIQYKESLILLQYQATKELKR